MTGKGLALVVILSFLMGAGPFGFLWWQARGEAKTNRALLESCKATLNEAWQAAANSDKGAAELARRPVAEIAKRAAAVKPRLVANGPEELAVISLERGDAAPFAGGLVGPVKFAEMTKALEDRDAWSLSMVKAEADRKRCVEAQADTGKRIARWKRKAISLGLGSGIAAWGLAKGKPWIAGAGLTAGISGALLF